MKRLLMVIVVCVVANPAVAADLMAVYQRALQNDPQLREAEATRLAALEAKPQALSALLPQLTGNGTITRERDTGSQNETEVVTLPTCVPPATPGSGTCVPPGTANNIFESFPFSGDITTTTHKYTLD